MKVYLLFHEYEVDGDEDLKVLGVFSSRAAAEAAVDKYRKLDGFSLYPNEFHIDGYELNVEHWTSGFMIK